MPCRDDSNAADGWEQRKNRAKANAKAKAKARADFKDPDRMGCPDAVAAGAGGANEEVKAG